LEIEGRAAWLRWMHPLATAIPHWLYRILDLGDSFESVMGDWLPPDEAMIFVSLSRAGLTGEALCALAAMSKKQTNWKKGITRALRPLVLVAIAFIAAFWDLSVTLFPNLFNLLPSGTELEGAALSLKNTSDFFAAYGPYLMGLAVLLPIGFGRMLPAGRGR